MLVDGDDPEAVPEPELQRPGLALPQIASFEPLHAHERERDQRAVEAMEMRGERGERSPSVERERGFIREGGGGCAVRTLFRIEWGNICGPTTPLRAYVETTLEGEGGPTVLKELELKIGPCFLKFLEQSENFLSMMKMSLISRWTK